MDIVLTSLLFFIGVLSLILGLGGQTLTQLIMLRFVVFCKYHLHRYLIDRSCTAYTSNTGVIILKKFVAVA